MIAAKLTTGKNEFIIGTAKDSLPGFRKDDVRSVGRLGPRRDRHPSEHG
jgi:hypothetical protein